ncbi:MAG: beta-lactamase family protein [Alphaproteobacteria bacterium]|nr:beta-lactamase family protein [Alphaproteobacteria bacterium]
MTPRSRAINVVLEAAVDRKEVPGVVAMAATDSKVVYEGAFGVRRLGDAPAMTLDTLFRIQSMTKAVTSVAAMQLVEQGRLALDEPVPAIDQSLSSPQVLSGFDAGGRPLLRPARRAITLKHLLTHTAGFSYSMRNPDIGRYAQATGTPLIMSGQLAALRMPLMFDPGDKWEYGINIDWVGRLVEALSLQDLDTYCRQHIFAPLGMADTGFVLTPGQQARQAAGHQRLGDGSLVVEPPVQPPPVREFFPGGGGLWSTAGDYLTFLRMLLNGGSLGGARILKPETVALMGENHTGALPVGVRRTVMREITNDVDLFPGSRLCWGLGYLVHLEAGPNGRSAGTVSWAGLRNSYYWVDPAKRVIGLIMTQLLPFADPQVLALYRAFERGGL